MSDKDIILPLTEEEILNVAYEGEDKTGNRYQPVELKCIVDHMLKGMKMDGRGKNVYKSGNSVTNIREDLNKLFPEIEYLDYDKKKNEHNRRSNRAISMEMTKLSYPLWVLKLMAYYEGYNRLNNIGLRRCVWGDCYATRVELLREKDIDTLTVGEYTPLDVDSPIIIRDNLSQNEINYLNEITKTYPSLRLNLKTKEQYDEQVKAGRIKADS